ncbi:hypothetical protein ACJX0J_026033, partial [Zea mays]
MHGGNGQIVKELNSEYRKCHIIMYILLWLEPKGSFANITKEHWRIWIFFYRTCKRAMSYKKRFLPRKSTSSIGDNRFVKEISGFIQSIITEQYLVIIDNDERYLLCSGCQARVNNSLVASFITEKRTAFAIKFSFWHKICMFYLFPHIKMFAESITSRRKIKKKDIQNLAAVIFLCLIYSINKTYNQNFDKKVDGRLHTFKSF